MVKVNFEQKVFLKHHKIPLRYVFDATGIRAKDYKIIMKDLGMICAIGVTPCGICNGVLKDRHSHCLFCHPASLTIRTRKNTYAYVYVAGSIKGNLLKIGYTEDYKRRIEKINENKYGGYNDWELIYKGKYLNAGEVENYLHTELKDYSVDIEYLYCGEKRICYETFKCDYYTVRKLIDNMNENLYSVTEEYYKSSAFDKYNY